MRHMFPVFILVTSAMLSGCVTENEDRLPIARPRVGDFYEYRAHDGTILEVRIRGIEERHDGRARVHETMIIQYVLERAKSDGGTSIIHSEEALDLTKGLIVQQKDLCYQRPPCNGSPLGIRFGAMGLPGAFGIGPFWTQHVMAPSSPIVVHPEIYRLEQLQLAGSNEMLKDSSCTSVSYLPELPNFQLYHVTWVGPVTEATICPETPLPVRFTPAFAAGAYAEEPRPVFHLTRFVQGTEEIRFGGRTSAWEDDFRPFRIEPWPALPRFIHSAEGADSRFALDEAHNQAQRLDDGYRMLTSRENALIWSFGGGRTGGSGSGSLLEPIFGSYTEDIYRWKLTVDAPGDSMQNFAIEKVIEERNGSTSVSYRMADPDGRTGSATTRLSESNIERAQANVTDVIEGFHSFMGKRVNRSGVGPAAEEDHELLKWNGYTLRMYHLPEVSDLPPDTMVITPWEMTVHGITGSILRIGFASESDIFEQFERLRDRQPDG